MNTKEKEKENGSETRTRTRSYAIAGTLAIAIALITAIMVMPAAAQLADTPWPKFHADMKNTGLSPYIGAQDPTLKWDFAVDGTIYYSSPAIDADGTIYVGSRYGQKIYAVNPDGTKKWEFVAGGEIYSSPAINTDGTIYFGSLDNKFYALNSDGTKKWEFVASDWIGSSPAIDTDGTIYFGSKDGKLYALNSDGTKKWEFVTGGWIYSSPAIGADGTIYVGSRDNKLYAVNPDGTKKWEFVTGSSVFSSPAISADGTIYFGSKDNKFYAVNSDGTKKWEFATGDDIYSSPAIGADSTIYIGSIDSKLYAFGPGPTPEYPDLVITNKSEALEDGTFTVTYTVANVGDGDASASNTTIFIDGTPVMEDPVPVLAAGASHTATVDPFDCPCGETLTIEVCADNDNVVEESDETNNCVVNVVECPAIPVDIDVKPGSCPNPLNLKSMGVLPVAVLGTAEFDVTTIDPGTILLTREGCEGVAAIRWSYEDVATPFTGELCDCNDLNGDGYIDLTLMFDTQELVSSLELDNVAGETIPLTVTGNLNAENGGTPIEGKDCIRVK